MGFEPWMCSALQWGQSEEPGSLGVLLLANSMTLSRSLHLCGPPVFLLLFCIYQFRSVAQSCPTLCNPMDYIARQAPLSMGFPRQEYWRLPFLFQGIFPTQGSNLGLPHCGQTLYNLSYQGSWRNTGVGSLSLLQGIFPIQESNQGLLHCKWILY